MTGLPAADPGSNILPNDDTSVKIIFVIGGPGVGKGTQCCRLARELDVIHVSVGDLLRAERRESSVLGDLIESHMREGTIVPSDITIRLLKAHVVMKVEEGSKHFLVDGFPRTMEQTQLFENNVRRGQLVLYFSCSKSLMRSRMLMRARTSARIDDNEETFERRYQGFLEDTTPIIKHFRDSGRLIEIDCEHSLNETYNEVRDTVVHTFNG